MKEYIKQMVEAIAIRQSHRHFEDAFLESSDETDLISFISSLDSPFDSRVEISLHEVPQGEKVVYFKGSPQFIALSHEDCLLEKAKSGFLGELVILFAESLGVKTCWMGHFKKETVYKIVHNSTKENSAHRIFCIIEVGYIPEKTGFLDRFSKWRMSKKNRTIDSFLHDKSLTEFPNEIEYALDLACKAPSAMNSQKWYYLVTREKNNFEIEISKLRNYQHFKWKHYNIDVGTAAAHCWLGLKEKNIEPKLRLERDGNEVVWRFSFTI